MNPIRFFETRLRPAALYVLMTAAFPFGAAQALAQDAVYLRPDAAKTATVKNLTLKRDAALFVLEEGTLHLTHAPDGSVCGAVFTGKGSFTLTPPTEIEQNQLRRFYQHSPYQERMTSLFLLFADSTADALQSSLTFTDGDVRNEARASAEVSEKLLQEPDVVKAIIDGTHSGMFFALINRLEIFLINPYDAEEVSFQREQEGAVRYALEPICQFHKAADYASGIDADERAEFIRLTQYTLDCRIAPDRYFSAVADVRFEALLPAQRYFYFSLYYELKVDSVVWDDGTRATFYRKAESPWLEIVSKREVKRGEVRSLRIYYQGDLIYFQSDLNWYYLKDSGGWYPRYGARLKTTFDITFRTPPQYQLVCTGNLVSSKTEGEVAVTHWVSEKPMRNASFNYGVFTEYKPMNDSIPPVTVWMAKGGHRELGLALGREGYASGAYMEKQVGDDIENSLMFYQALYGKSAVEKFYATEHPFSHGGEAFPGLVHLYWRTFQRTERDGSDELLRAHEVAHQWWGIGVDFKTYHDQWLSEAFAEYSALWYIQAALKDNPKFFDMLRKWREEIINNRKFLFGKGQDAAPVWLGYRNESSTTKGDYNTIVYQKGAWILQMLRNMMIDFNTMNEDPFRAMMKDFYQTHAGKSASTADFKATVDKHFKQDMSWFFKQWVYETAVPTYKFAYKTDEAENGKFKVRCRVSVENVPESFRMYVPLQIEFGEEKRARLRVLIQGKGGEFDLPLLPARPQEVKFNIFESVLCDVQTAGW